MNFKNNHVEPPGTPRRNLRSQTRPRNKDKKPVRLQNRVLFQLKAGPYAGFTRQGLIVNKSNFRFANYPTNEHFKVKVNSSKRYVIVPVSLIRRVLKRDVQEKKKKNLGTL
jgi:hypothetical protein